MQFSLTSEKVKELCQVRRIIQDLSFFMKTMFKLSFLIKVFRMEGKQHFFIENY